MKKFANLVFLIFILLIVVPLIVLKSCNNETPKVKKENIDNIDDIQKVKVYISDQDKVIEMQLDEYVKGVVAAEMPASFEIEALKAQTLAARTYTLLKVIKNKGNSDEYHKGGDICTNFAHCQAYKNNKQLKETWGIVEYYKNLDRISKAVDETKDLVITYQDDLINPLFHSTSGGKTENSEDVFQSKLPYLRSVISLGEEASPRYTSKVVLSFDEFKNRLLNQDKELILNKNDIKNIKIINESEGLRVKQIQIGNKVFKGTEIRNVFSLNSTNFKISLEKNNIIIKTIGYGHGVGMSQFGANALAKQGKNFNDILTYYYLGTEIKNISNLK